MSLQMDVTTEDITSDDVEVRVAPNFSPLLVALSDKHFLLNFLQVWPFDHSKAGVYAGACIFLNFDPKPLTLFQKAATWIQALSASPFSVITSFQRCLLHDVLRYSTVLLKLAPGQEVSFEFIARRGIGKVLNALRLCSSSTAAAAHAVSDAREVVASSHCCFQIRSRR
jgi:hypothetical protein